MKKHVKRLHASRKKAEKSLLMFTKTQAKLQAQNDEIEKTVEEIESDLVRLSQIKSALANQRDGNAAVIANIDKIVKG